MYDQKLQGYINNLVRSKNLDIAGADNAFYTRLLANAGDIKELYQEIYENHPAAATGLQKLLESIVKTHLERPETLKTKDREKSVGEPWFLSNELAGMSLYVDRFCKNLKGMPDKLGYLENLGINLLHLMPLFESPAAESDGGYAVSDFRKVDRRFGTLSDLKKLVQTMQEKGMYLMLDIVLNHTSDQHEWAQKAKAGDSDYRDFFHLYPDRTVPDQFEKTMPEVFPESAPGSFTWNEECRAWVMTVFHSYQWDLNYTNPAVLVAMLDNIFFYANLGVDILRIDAPAFIWKQIGTTCQNLPQAHTLLRLIRLCTEVAAPGMALLGEAIVGPKDILVYFGLGRYAARECHVAYNATTMALLWDALATADTRILLASQEDLFQKPYGATWINYTRCHDDIGLGFEDEKIRQSGFDPYAHRKFLKDYYSGHFHGSPATGALFSVNPRTQDARISGTLASLCGLEKALAGGDEAAIETAIRRILLLQAFTIFLGGIPMLFYGDEAGYTNDYSYLKDPGKDYDNRWMHRPVIDWQKNARAVVEGTMEHRIFSGTQKLLALRKSLPVFGDYKNITWLNTGNSQVAGFLRHSHEQQVVCLFNFGVEQVVLDRKVLLPTRSDERLLVEGYGIFIRILE